MLAVAAIPLLAVIALMAPSASAATGSAVRPALHISAKATPTPDVPFPDCGDFFTFTRQGKNSIQVKVVGYDLNQFGNGTKKLFITDTGDSEVYGPYQVGSSFNRDIPTNGTSPVTFALELTDQQNEPLCSGDYYA